jgi:hypothetical protein
MGSQLSDFELGWLVGILEGEGTFRYFHKSQKVVVQMSDEDTVYRIAATFERLTGQTCEVKDVKPQKTHHSLMHYVALNGESARIVMRTVVKHMSHRRRQKIWQCLNAFDIENKRVKIDLVKLALVTEEPTWRRKQI